MKRRAWGREKKEEKKQRRKHDSGEQMKRGEKASPGNEGGEKRRKDNTREPKEKKLFGEQTKTDEPGRTNGKRETMIPANQQKQTINKLILKR